MTRRRWLLRLLFALGALAIVLGLWAAERVPRWAVRTAAARITAATGRPVSYGAVRTRLWPFEIEVRDLTIGGASPGTPFLLHVTSLRSGLALRSLWRQHIVLKGVVVRGATMNVEAFEQGGDNIPRTRRSRTTASAFALEMRRLTIEDSVFVLDHRRVPLHLDVPDLQAQLAQRRDGLTGRLAFGVGAMALGASPPLPLGADVELRIAERRLWVTAGRIRTRRADLACRGDLTLEADPNGSFALHGPVDLAELDTHIWRTDLGLAGDGVFDGRLIVTHGSIGFDGRLSGQRGVFDGVAVPGFDGHLIWGREGLVLRDLSVETLGGTALVDFTLPAEPAAVRLVARYEDVAAEGALRAIFDLGPMGVASRATGRAELAWRRPGQQRLTGEVVFDLTEASSDLPGTPVSGRMEWTAQDGQQRIEHAMFATPSTHLRMTGAIAPDESIDLNVDLASQSLAATDDIGARLRRSLGRLDAIPAGAAGRGRFEGRCRGTLDVPRCTGRFRGQDFGYLNVTWGDIEWSGTVDVTELTSRSLVLKKHNAELWVDGRMELGDFSESDAWDLTVRVLDWPVEDLIAALQWNVRATGRATADLRLRGRRSHPLGSADVRVQAGTYFGVPFSDFTGRVRLEGARSELSDGTVSVGDGRVEIAGSATRDAVYDGAAVFHDVDLAPLQRAWRPEGGAPLAGQLTGRVAFRGTLSRPWLDGELRVPALLLGREPVGEAVVTLEGRGAPRIGVRAECKAAATSIHVRAALQAVPPFEASLATTVRKTSLRPLLVLLRPDLPADLDVTTSGDLRLAGSFADPRSLSGDLVLPLLEIALPDHPLQLVRPAHVALEAGHATFEDLVLAGEGTRLSVSGAIPFLEADDPLRLEVGGAADLRVLSILGERLRGRGAARLAMAVGGTRNEPSLEGALDIEDGGIRFRGFPHGLDALRGTVRFDEAAARIETLVGELGGGEVRIAGEAGYAGGHLGSFDVQIQGTRLALRYPEGLRSVVDADVRIAGDSDRQWVTGDVDVRHAVWTRRYDLTSELMSTGGIPRGTAPFAEGLRYDVRLHAPGTLRVDNNLAVLDARAELSLRGTVEHPVVIGRADVDRGRLYFRGNTYVIRRGVIDFADPNRIDPFFDIEAETSLRGYRVSLAVNGTLDRVHPTLSSDPPLSPLQILNLLAGADESTITSLAQAQRDQAYLAATGAASLAAGRLSEEMGLERGAQRFFGLSRFSIDPRTVNPALAESEITTTARLTVAKRLNPDLTVLYARDLGGREEHLLSVEYVVSDRVALLLTRSQRAGEEGEIGFDVFLRHTR